MAFLLFHSHPASDRGEMNGMGRDVFVISCSLNISSSDTRLSFTHRSSQSGYGGLYFADFTQYTITFSSLTFVDCPTQKITGEAMHMDSIVHASVSSS